MIVRTLVAVSALIGAVALPAAAAPASRGAGAELPARAFQAWCSASSLCTYVPTGDAGASSLRRGGARWAGADDRFTRAQARRAGGPVAYYPMMLGGIAVAVNVPGIQGHNIDLRGTTIAEIFSGAIRNWNDKRIRQTNLHHPLPRNLPITLCVPARPSGESWDFSEYLARVSAIFRRQVGGASPRPKWRAAKIVRTPRMTAVGECMQANRGAITFLPISDAMREGLTSHVVAVGKRERVTHGKGVAARTVVRNVFTHPTGTAIAKAGRMSTARATSAPTLNLLNSPVRGAYPITTEAYAVTRSDRPINRLTLRTLRYFLSPAAQRRLQGLGYAPLPANLATATRARLAAAR